jgi:hypothetical protein
MSVSNLYTQLIKTIQTELSGQLAATQAELTQVKSLMDHAIDDLVDSFISLEATTRIGQNLVLQLASNQTLNTQDELNPFREKQIKSAQLLLDTTVKLNKLLKDAKQNEATASLLNSNQSGDKDKLISELQTNSKLLSEQSREVAQLMKAVTIENESTINMVAEEISITSTQIEKDVQMAVKSLQFQDMTTQLIVQCVERQKIMQELLNKLNAVGDSKNESIDALEKSILQALTDVQQTNKMRMKEFNVDAGSVELF